MVCVDVYEAGIIFNGNSDIIASSNFIFNYFIFL